MAIVSIIVPTYNRATIIHNCLDSVKSQSFKDFECIVVDDFSEDNTEEIIFEYKAKDSRFKYLKNNQKKGAPGARNTGLYSAVGEFVMFLDSDDLINENCLNNRIQPFLSHEVDLVISLQQRVIDNLKENIINIPTDIDPLIRFFSYGPRRDIPWINNTLIRKKFLTKNEIKWDEEIHLFQDIQFNLNLLSHEPNLKWINTIDSYWVFNSKNESIGKNKNQSIEKHIKLLEFYTFYYNKNNSINNANFRLLTKQFKSCIIFLLLHINFYYKQPISFTALKLPCFDLLSKDTKFMLSVYDRFATGEIKLLNRFILKIARSYLIIRNKPVINTENFCMYKEDELLFKISTLQMDQVNNCNDIP